MLLKILFSNFNNNITIQVKLSNSENVTQKEIFARKVLLIILMAPKAN
jgi:hypothetical protein